MVTRAYKRETLNRLKPKREKYHLLFFFSGFDWVSRNPSKKSWFLLLRYQFINWMPINNSISKGEGLQDSTQSWELENRKSNQFRASDERDNERQRKLTSRKASNGRNANFVSEVSVDLSSSTTSSLEESWFQNREEDTEKERETESPIELLLSSDLTWMRT